MYASCDAFLMPSLFEPCGLSQLMSLRCGTLFRLCARQADLGDTVGKRIMNLVTRQEQDLALLIINAHEMLNTRFCYAEGLYYDRKRDWNKIRTCDEQRFFMEALLPDNIRNYTRA